MFFHPMKGIIALDIDGTIAANAHALDIASKTSFGVIGIHQHQINCVVGIYSEERQHEQTLFVDAKIKLNLSRCFASGQMQDTVDYVLLAQLCTQLAQQNQYLLLETFASDILSQCLEHLNAVWAWVRIQKPAAIPTAAYAYVELERYCEKKITSF